MSIRSSRRQGWRRGIALAGTWTAGLLTLATLALPLTPSSTASPPLAETPADGGSPGSAAALPPLLFLQLPMRAGIVVMDPTGLVKFQMRQHHPFKLASVSKLYIMVAFLDQVAAENRDLTNEESLLLEQMITVSDNHAATDLWRRIGGADGLSDYLDKAGLARVEPPEDEDSWGSMRTTASNFAVLLAALYQRELLPNRFTMVALEHLANVSEEQAWGLGTARNPSGLRVPAVYFKNGWYPEEDGWIANSVGIIADRTGPHVFVLLTDRQPTLEDAQGFLNAATYLLRVHLGAIPLFSPRAVESSR